MELNLARFWNLFYAKYMESIIKNIKKLGFNGEILFNESMKNHTSFKVGGNASVFAYPYDIDSLILLLQYLKSNGVGTFILGGGTNILVSDGGIDGVVICTTKLNKIQLDCTTVICHSGLQMRDFVSTCSKAYLTGMEEFAGLPGTVGGAVYMNARCFDKSICDILKSVRYLDKDFCIKTYRFNKEDWSYKHSPFMLKENVIVEATFALLKGQNAININEKCTYYIGERKARGHYRYPCAGSVFLNDRAIGKPTGKLIQEAHLCGYKIGDAQIAPWHGNIIINTNSASANDIKQLIDYVKNTIKQKYGFDLKCEVILCGKWS